MPIYALGELEPNIDSTAFVHPEAVVIGDVHIGAQSSVWPCAVLRGDGATITIGNRTSVQDGSVIHTTTEVGTTVGDDCVIGHLVHLEACTIHDNVLVGVGAIVLHNVIVHSGAIVAANCVLLNDMMVPAGAVAMGVPAKIREGAAHAEMAKLGSASYVFNTERYRRDLRRIG
jgi:carbonic anhydrase/acetyltransferase-like protein (isoleucine patch superfamily)